MTVAAVSHKSSVARRQSSVHVVFTIVLLAGVAISAQEMPHVVIGLFAPLQVLRVPVEARAIKGAPYFAEMITESVQLLGDGNRIIQRTTGRVYRDSDGRVRREEDRPADGHTHPVISITDPVAGVSYSLDPVNRVASKAPGPFGWDIRQELDRLVVTLRARSGAEGAVTGIQLEKLADAAKALVVAKAATAKVDVAGGIERGRGGRGGGATQVNEVSTQEKLTETMEGVKVDGYRATTTIPAGTVGNERPIVIESEEWKSPDLQVLVMTRHQDPRSGETTYRLANIVRTEQALWLFQVPADYTVREAGIRGIPGIPKKIAPRPRE